LAKPVFDTNTFYTVVSNRKYGGLGLPLMDFATHGSGQPYTDGPPSLPQVAELKGPLRDGWGLTTDGKQLIATDSSATVSFLDPVTLKVGLL